MTFERKASDEHLSARACAATAAFCCASFLRCGFAASKSSYATNEGSGVCSQWY